MSVAWTFVAWNSAVELCPNPASDLGNCWDLQLHAVQVTRATLAPVKQEPTAHLGTFLFDFKWPVLRWALAVM